MTQIASLKWRHGFAVLVAGLTFLLLFAGGMVTSTDSGLAVPDWPLSYGMWLPPMVGGIFYEHGHRMIAATVGFLILVMTIWFGAAEERTWVRRLVIAALGAVVLQGILGGMTVLFLLPPQISIAHALLGNGVFCLAVAVALCTSPRWEEAPQQTTSVRGAKLIRVCKSTAHAAVLQLFLGALIRHTHVPVMVHILGAMLVLVVALLCTTLVWVDTAAIRLRAGALRLLVLVGIQILLGFAAWGMSSVPWLVTLHVVCGSLILVQSVILAWNARRFIIPA